MPDLLVSPEIDAYCVAQTTPLPPLLEELVRETKSQFAERSGMLSGQVEGMFLRTLIGVMGAKRVLEVGTFTGFSGLMMASALPDDGELITLELDPKHAAFARSYFERSPDGGKIGLIEGPALDSMRALRGEFDLIFVDADKPNYANYYEAALPLLAERGLMAIDNVLWSGTVTDPQDDNGRAIAALNDRIAADERVEQVILSVRDGVTLVRKR